MTRAEAARREDAILEAHKPADLTTIMRPYHYPKGVTKVQLLMVEADDVTEGGIVIPGIAQAKTGEAVVIDVGDVSKLPEPLGLQVGDRVMIAKYMGSIVALREKWVDPQSGNDKYGERTYVTLDPSHILNKFEKVDDEAS